MSKYHIDFLEEKPTKIGPIIEASVTDEHGVQTDKVALFPSNWPNWKELKPGSDIMGELSVKQNGKWTNKTLFPEKTDTMSSPRAPAWAKQKEKTIEKAMDRKDESIQRAGIQRDATLLTVTLINAHAAGKILDLDDVKKEWQSWKAWLENEANDPGVPFD